MFHVKINSVWTEMILFSIASIFLYQTSIGIFFFLIPLQILYRRRGNQLFNYSLLLTFLVIALIKTIRISRLDNAGFTFSLVLLEILVLISLLGGLFLLNANIFEHFTGNLDLDLFRRKDNFFDLLSLSILFGIVSIPFILYFGNNTAFNDYMNLVFKSLSDYLKTMFTTKDTENLAILNKFLSAETLKETTNRIFFRTFIFDYFILLGFSRWIGNAIGRKNLQRESIEKSRLDVEKTESSIISFKVPEYYLWPLIVSLALTLIDYIRGLGVIGYVSWNATLILALLYGINALGIIRYLFGYFRVSRGLQLLLYFMLIILLFTPKINIIVLIAIPGLGVSEIWIKYREFERRDE